jgi:multiple sugar transport system permease protein
MTFDKEVVPSGNEPGIMSAILMRQPLVLVLLFLPSGLLVGLFLIYPLVNGVWLGFTDASPLNRSLHFVGVENFADLLTDPKFWQVLWNSAFLIITSIVLSTLLGFVIALLLTSGIRFVGLFRTAVFQVWLVPWIAVAILWGWIFNSDYGIVNFVLIDIGVLARPQKWLADPLLAQLVIISAFTWRQIPFMMVVSLAALQGIPRELVEAASIDGAGYARQLAHIVLPLVRYVMMVVALLQAVRLFQEITLPWVLTQGGPINATTTLSLYAYKIAFERWDFGLASAVGTIWLLLLAGFAMVYVRLLVAQR